MIQRIQSVFLFLASIGFISLFKLPFAQSNIAESPLFEDQMFNITDHTVLTGLSIIGSLACLINIFLFRNRLLQMRIGYLCIISSFFLILVAVWLVYSSASQWSNQLNVDDGIGIYTTVFTLIFVIGANYFIKKDENTVRSMDRLR